MKSEGTKAMYRQESTVSDYGINQKGKIMTRGPKLEDAITSQPNGKRKSHGNNYYDLQRRLRQPRQMRCGHHPGLNRITMQMIQSDNMPLRFK